VDWEGTYRSRLSGAQEAVKAVQSGDTVVYSIFPPRPLQDALFARADELSDVTLRLLAPAYDPGWLRPGAEDHFKVEYELYVGDFARFTIDERRATYVPNLFSLGMKAYDKEPRDLEPPDVAMVIVSPPNKQGYCHFGPHNWNQRNYTRRCKTTIALVDPGLAKVYGDCYVHVSEIAQFVEYDPPTMDRVQFDVAIKELDEDRRQAWSDLWNELPDPGPVLGPFAAILAAVPPDSARRLLGLDSPPDFMRTIAGYLSELITDGDTIQIGTGEPSRFMARLGVFDGRRDLGIHTELGWPGLAAMVRDGIATGRHKEIHTGKAVATAWTGCDFNDLAIIDDNPGFELYDPNYVLSPRTLTRFDRFVAINNAISIDLLGQINSESVFGGRLINGSGGQPEMHMAGAFSPNGKAITLLPSTALDGSVSKIVPQLEAGSLVTIPRFYADIVVTEYGIARLWGKSHQARANELIAVAHPDYRAELKNEAERLWWP